MNSFGRFFRVTIFGESHGKMLGVTIDGCPAGIPMKEEDFLPDLKRRKSGGKGTTPRKEPDLPNIASGVFKGYTTGAPITIYYHNRNTISKDYSNLIKHPRPGHADFVAIKKFGGFGDYTGGGHFSGRLTLGLVTAGVVAKKIIDPIKVEATLVEAGGRKDIMAAVDEALEKHDSIGGVIECKATNMMVGLGEPFFDSIESTMAHMIFSIPAMKGIEFGAGFAATKMYGSEHNDNFIDEKGTTETNHAGGINGGISNGNDLVFRVGVKPTSSVGVPQQTMNLQKGEIQELLIRGRHDACIALRAPVVVECAAAIVLADFVMLEHRQKRVWKQHRYEELIED